AVYEVFAAQPWDGNVRELADVLRAAAAAAKGEAVRPNHLPHELRVRAGLEAAPARPKPPELDATLAAVERRLIELALRRADGHQGKAAELLGVFRARLSRRLEALGIPAAPQPARPGEADSP
ncbi:MAG TPA: helix-turn-helix domain-containing protein, partial [Gemmata sp.]|nr:helix-turn-helix domain-containing protein [Gemmata sp.]